MKGEWKKRTRKSSSSTKPAKKGFGPFKLELWHLPADIRAAICAELERQFAFLFDKLKVSGTGNFSTNASKSIDVPLKMPPAIKG